LSASRGRLWRRRPRNGAAILARTARPAGRRAHEGLEADAVEHADELFELLGERIDFLAHPWKKERLDMAPAQFHGGDRVVTVHGGGSAQTDS
jgi:hypothetical protein